MDGWNNENTYGNGNTPNGNIPPKRSGFLIAALILGILAFCSVCTGLFPLFLGSLSILFVVLSKRKGQPMDPMGVISLILSLIGIIVGLAFTVFAFVTVLSDEGLYQEMNEMMEEMYGMDMEEYWEYALPDDGSL